MPEIGMNGGAQNKGESNNLPSRIHTHIAMTHPKRGDIFPMEHKMLSTVQVLEKLNQALLQRRPFSLVRIGDGENLVLAQNSVWAMELVLKERWAIKANRGQKGLHLPNLPLRDAVRDAVAKADVVGILPHGDTSIIAPAYLKRPLTDQIFQHFSLKPKAICDARINREMLFTQQFYSVVTPRRIVLVTRQPEPLKQTLTAPPYCLNIVHTLPFGDYSQMDATLEWFKQNGDTFDLALFSCGVNAVVLAQKTAELTGKAALDFGKATNIILKGTPN